MTVELFDSIINTSQDCVFWKDKERRFLGVNQSFLDYYGFESDDILIGKTDEDMGWHNDPEPFKQDELRVLAGESTYKVMGKCIIRGEERDIIASKRPLYEGNEIVGLVGSFVDVTDVIRRKSKSDGYQVMYTIDSLRKYPFFDRILDDVSMEEILDPLTGILCRAYALEFVHSLIATQTPFSFTILDLDNFKSINDNFGHHCGDIVLKEVSAGLANYTEGYGLVGRFGGDELLIINLRDITYDEKKQFFNGLYLGGDVLRRKVKLRGQDVFVTGTAGCASYPEDATEFDILFDRIDKTLYRGKNKGRNCYVIYVEEKHKDLDIRKLAKNGICSDMKGLARVCEQGNSPLEKLHSAMPFLKEVLQIKDLYYVNKDGRMHAILDESLDEDARDIDCVMEDAIYADNLMEDISNKSPLFYATVRKCGFESVLIVRVEKDGIVKGHLLCGVQRSMRIWQENECALLFFLSRLLSAEEWISS